MYNSILATNIERMLHMIDSIGSVIKKNFDEKKIFTFDLTALDCF